MVYSFGMKQVLKDHFVPHQGNAYSPHVLQKAAMFAMGWLVVLSFALANAQALFWVTSDWMVSTILPAVIINDTNEERQAGSIVTLHRNAVLDRAAQMKAEDMAEKGYFAHFSPEGVSPWHWFEEADYGFVHAGENLAIHFTDSGEVVDAWMDSPTHRANILNKDFREIGIGVAEGRFEGYQTLYVVQLFGTQAVAAPVTTEIAQPPVTAALAFNVNESLSPEEPVKSVAGIEESVVPEVVEANKAAEADDGLAVPTDLSGLSSGQSVSEESSPAVVYSNFISTSTGGVPATVSESSLPVNTERPFWTFLTQPQFVLQLLYAAIGLLVVGALLLSILIEIKRQKPVQIAYGVLLLVLMYGLYAMHLSVTTGAVVI